MRKSTWWLFVFRFCSAVSGLVMVVPTASVLISPGPAGTSANPQAGGLKYWTFLIFVALASYTTFIAIVMMIGGSMKQCLNFIPLMDISFALIHALFGLVMMSAGPRVFGDDKLFGMACLPTMTWASYADGAGWLLCAIFGPIFGWQKGERRELALGITRPD